MNEANSAKAVEVARAGPLRVFLSWWTQEKFWQDITTRSVSALIVLLAVYLFGLTQGFWTASVEVPIGIFIFVPLALAALSVAADAPTPRRRICAYITAAVSFCVTVALIVNSL